MAIACIIHRRTGASAHATHMDSPRRLLIILILVAAARLSSPRPGPNPPHRSRLEVTRDTWVSDVGPEADGNNGARPRLKLKSIQEMSLVDIDARPLVGRTIRSAVLHLKKAGDERLERVTVSSVGAEWFEGTGSGYAVQPGGATFRHRRHPDLPWSIGGGDLCHVVLGNGGTLWRMADASPPDRDGWQHIPVDPRVVAARVAGLSHGFLALRRHRLGMDKRRREVHTPALSQPLCLQPRTEPVERSVFHDRARAGRPPAAGGPERSSRSSRRQRCCRPARRSSRGSRPETTDRPERSASS